MGHSFETMLDAFLPTLVKCCAKANKVFVLRGSACLVDIMRHCRPVKLLPKFVDHLGNASKSARIAVASSFLALLEVFQEGNFTKDAPTQDANGEHPKLPFPHVLKDHVNDIKNILNLALCDAAPEVRHAASRSFILFQKYFPEQANL